MQTSRPTGSTFVPESVRPGKVVLGPPCQRKLAPLVFACAHRLSGRRAGWDSSRLVGALFDARIEGRQVMHTFASAARVIWEGRAKGSLYRIITFADPATDEFLVRGAVVIERAHRDAIGNLSWNDATKHIPRALMPTILREMIRGNGNGKH